MLVGGSRSRRRRPAGDADPCHRPGKRAQGVRGEIDDGRITTRNEDLVKLVQHRKCADQHDRPPYDSRRAVKHERI